MDKQAREYKKHLTNLVKAAELYITRLDKVMKHPIGHMRGQGIARLTNDLNMAKDLAKHFGLGISLKKKL